MIVLLSSRLVEPLSYVMRNEQISKTSNILMGLVSLYIIGDWNFESEWEWWIQSIIFKFRWNLKPIPWSINFQVETTKKDLHLQVYQQLCSMTSIYLGKMCVHFSKLLFLKRNENAIFFFKITLNKVKGLFFSWKVLFLLCYVWEFPSFSK